MTKHSGNSKDEFERAIDFLLEDIASMSPKEIRAELDEMGISEGDAQSMVKQAFEQCQRDLGAAKLAQAKKTLREQKHQSNVTPITGAKAKTLVQEYWQKNPGEAPTTMAARKGSAISEDTAKHIYQSLVDLGAIHPDEDINDV
jgi:hypothetical protein